jgi:hypothetical protein
LQGQAATERVDDSGIKLGAGVASKLGDRIVCAAGRLVAAVLGHGLVGVTSAKPLLPQSPISPARPASCITLAVTRNGATPANTGHDPSSARGLCSAIDHRDTRARTSQSAIVYRGTYRSCMPVIARRCAGTGPFVCRAAHRVAAWAARKAGSQHRGRELDIGSRGGCWTRCRRRVRAPVGSGNRNRSPTEGADSATGAG